MCDVKQCATHCTIQAAACGTPNTPAYNLADINRVGDITISIVLMARVCVVGNIVCDAVAFFAAACGCLCCACLAGNNLWLTI